MLPLQVEGQLGVAHHQLQEAHLLAALRGPDPDERPPPLREPRLEQLALRHVVGDEDLARNVTARGVELLDGRAEQGLGLGEPVEQVALAGHDLAVANREDLDRRALALHVDPEEVALLQVRGRDLLRRLQPLERAHLVAQAGRLLEPVFGGGHLHLLPEPARHLLGAALEEEPGVLAALAVALERAHLGHAGCEAALDLVLEAGARPLAVEGLLAGADAEELPRQARGLAAQVRGDVGPAVGVLVFPGPAHHVEPRVLLGQGELQVGMVLVVAEPQIVERLVALDEVVLESQGLHLRVRDHEVEVDDLLDHAGLVELDGT